MFASGKLKSIIRGGKIMKKLRKMISCVMLLVFSMMIFALAGCGTSASSASSSTAPANFTFNTTDGTFSFDAVSNAETYLVGISKVLNDTTGAVLQSINGAVQITKPDGIPCYIWSEQSGSCTGLADIDNDGKVEGTVVFREYSSSASTVGAVMTMGQLPVGHYIAQAMAAYNDKLPNSEPAIYEFVIGGTLATPSGFTGQVNSDGYMEITAPSEYYVNCLTVTGMPEKMIFEIKDGESTIETIKVDDFSYTNTVLGPNKTYTFKNGTVVGTTNLEAGKEYTVTVTAVGDGDQIKDASAPAYMATNTAATEFANVIDTNASGTCGDYSIIVTLGTDSSGNNIYELTASVNNIIIIRESGTYTTDAEIQLLDDLNTYSDGSTLSFATQQTDASAGILDGKTLTVTRNEVEARWNTPSSTSYILIGEGLSIDGTSFNFAVPVSSGGFPG
jgi:hypothetical protein